MLRRFLSSPLGLRIASALIATYVRLATRTTRWRVVGDERGLGLCDDAAPLILAFWHGRLLAMPEFRRRRLASRRMAVLSSTHRDGLVSAATLRRYGLDVIPGSSRRGGSQGLRRLVAWVRDGHSAAITPDGPRGPRMQARAGVLMLARLADAPVVPVAFSTTRGRSLGSWDRMLLPLPFGRGVYVVGAPIRVPPDADEAAVARLHAELEAALTAAMIAADAACGRDSPSPPP